MSASVRRLVIPLSVISTAISARITLDLSRNRADATRDKGLTQMTGPLPLVQGGADRIPGVAT